MGAPPPSTAGQVETLGPLLSVPPGEEACILIFWGRLLCGSSVFCLLTVLFALHSMFPNINGGTRGRMGRELGEEVVLQKTLLD